MRIISASRVFKLYCLGKKNVTLKERFVNCLSRTASANSIWALRDVSLMVDTGETVGIIGSNGAGKSTLLRLLAKVSRPTSGRVEIKGRMAALLDLGAGFHPDLTGRENVFLNGTLLGMTRAEIKKKFDEIVAFSEVERFIDTPVKYFSRGMTLRLGFAVAAQLRCEILVFDEVLSVGDARFKEKCFARMRHLRDQGITTLIASHDLRTVENFCSRALLFQGGRLIADGRPKEVLGCYKSKSVQAQPFDQPDSLGRHAWM